MSTISDQIAALNQQKAAKQTEIDAKQLEITNDTALITQDHVDQANIDHQIAVLMATVQPNSIPAKLGPKCTAKRVNHKMAWFTKGGKHPKDPKRAPGYDQLVVADVINDVKADLAAGYYALDFDAYPIGSISDRILSVYMSVLPQYLLRFMVSIDKGVWQTAPDWQSAAKLIQDYIDKRLRLSVFTNPMYEKWNNKFIVKFFSTAKGPDTPQTWALLAKNNPDIEFVGNVNGFSHSTYYWHPDSDPKGLATYCSAHGRDTSGIFMPGFFAGFDTTYLGYDVWAGAPTPARVNPPGVGPNQATFDQTTGMIKAACDAGGSFFYVLNVSGNDFDEFSRTDKTPNFPTSFYDSMYPTLI
jgi:hypothetical protein